MTFGPSMLPMKLSPASTPYVTALSQENVCDSFLVNQARPCFSRAGRVRAKELLLSDYQDYASAVWLTHGASEPLECCSEPDELRTRAARYRHLAETLIDVRVIAVVRACARELEMEAISIERENDTCSGIGPHPSHR